MIDNRHIFAVNIATGEGVWVLDGYISPQVETIYMGGVAYSSNYVIDNLTLFPGYIGNYTLYEYDQTFEAGELQRRGLNSGSQNSFLDEFRRISSLIEKPAASISINNGQTSVNEGGSLQLEVNTEGLVSGSKLQWLLAGDEASEEDFTSSSGEILLDDNRKAILSIYPIADQLTEGNESVQLVINNLQGAALTSIDLNIGDTSVNIEPKYSLDFSTDSISEGDILNSIIRTVNIIPGTALYWSIQGEGITDNDFAGYDQGEGVWPAIWQPLAGSTVVQDDGNAYLSHQIANDNHYEKLESMEISIYLDRLNISSVILSDTIRIIDSAPDRLQLDESQLGIYTFRENILIDQEGIIELPLFFITGNNESLLPGLVANIHFNSSYLSPVDSGVIFQHESQITKSHIKPDLHDLDQDPLTDLMIEMIWVSFESTFPGKELPAELARVQFQRNQSDLGQRYNLDPITGIRTSATDTPSNYQFMPSHTSVFLPEIRNTGLFSLDVDGDGVVTPLGDGLMIIRKLFGSIFSGDALTNKAISPDASRSTEQIHAYIDDAIEFGALDVDRDGLTTPLGDGLMIIRHLFGSIFSGDALLSKAISNESIYYGTTFAPDLVTRNIESLML